MNMKMIIMVPLQFRIPSIVYQAFVCHQRAQILLVFYTNKSFYYGETMISFLLTSLLAPRARHVRISQIQIQRTFNQHIAPPAP